MKQQVAKKPPRSSRGSRTQANHTVDAKFKREQKPVIQNSQIPLLLPKGLDQQSRQLKLIKDGRRLSELSLRKESADKEQDAKVRASQELPTKDSKAV